MDFSTATKIAFRKGAKTLADGAKSLPQKYFVSPDIFAEEQTEDFFRAMAAGRASESDPEAGDYFVAPKSRAKV